MNTVYVPLSGSVLVRLVERYEDRFAAVIDDVIEDFLERTSDEGIPSKQELGYVWGHGDGQVLLPHGTQLRTWYMSEWRTATLENGKFRFNDKVRPTPSKICNLMRGGTQNNAWKLLEIKRPQDTQFRVADLFRRKR